MEGEVGGVTPSLIEGQGSRGGAVGLGKWRQAQGLLKNKA